MALSSVNGYGTECHRVGRRLDHLAMLDSDHMNRVGQVAKRVSRVMLLAACCALTACGGTADHLVKRGPEGAVVLERLPARGTTIRYSGQLKSFRASHPVSLSPETVGAILRCIHVGIAPSEGGRSASGIKPTALFSPAEVGFLAPAIAAALAQAEPDQRVRFEMGPESDRSSGTLYIDDSTMRLALSHFHSNARQTDEHLSIYILSMKPEEVQDHTPAPRAMLAIDPEEPQLAVAYGRLGHSSPPEEKASAQPAPAPESRSLKEVVDQQSRELEALKAELETLKKQTQRPSAPSRPAP